MKKFIMDIDRLHSRVARIVKRDVPDIGDQVVNDVHDSVYSVGVVREIRGSYALVDWNDRESQYEWRDSLRIFNAGYEHPLPDQSTLSPHPEINAVFDDSTIVKCGIARSSHEKTAGLTKYAYLPPYHGLLFPFPGSKDVSFRMSTVSYPIDIVFVRSVKGSDNGVISKIARHIEPNDKRMYGDSDVLFVVEVNGGFCRKHNIREGTSVQLSAEEDTGGIGGNDSESVMYSGGGNHDGFPVGDDGIDGGEGPLNGVDPTDDEHKPGHQYRRS